MFVLGLILLILSLVKGLVVRVCGSDFFVNVIGWVFFNIFVIVFRWILVLKVIIEFLFYFDEIDCIKNEVILFLNGLFFEFYV